MKISVITVCFNSAHTLEDTIKSVVSQTHYDIEYIIIDGGSTDTTGDIINRHKASIQFSSSEKDDGIYDAMNKGIQKATGDIVCILNSDDVYIHNHVLSTMADIFTNNPDLHLAFGDLEFKTSDLSRLVRVCRFRRFRPWLLRFGWMPPHPATFARREIYDRYGLYKLDYQISSDYEMFVRWLLVHNLRWLHVPGKLITMRMGGASTASLKSSWVLNMEIVKACRNNKIYTNIFLILLKIPFKLIELRRQ